MFQTGRSGKLDCNSEEATVNREYEKCGHHSPVTTVRSQRKK